MYTNSWDPNNGQILISTDQGKTFTPSALPFKVGGNMPGRGMGEVRWFFSSSVLRQCLTRTPSVSSSTRTATTSCISVQGVGTVCTNPPTMELPGRKSRTFQVLVRVIQVFNRRCSQTVPRNLCRRPHGHNWLQQRYHGIGLGDVRLYFRFEWHGDPSYLRWCGEQGLRQHLRFQRCRFYL